ncbi:MAG: YcjF family protein [Limisphaerales bacterium]
MATSPSASAASAAKETLPTETVEVSADDRLSQADKIVKNNMYWSMGVGAVPVPLVDLVGIAGFQIRMIKELSHLYGVRFSEHTAKNIVSALIGSIGARALTVITVGSMIKTLPMAGAFIGGVLCMPAIAGGTTYAVGKVFIRHYESGGTLLDLNTDKAKAYFSAKFQEGKKLVSEPKRAS